AGDEPPKIVRVGGTLDVDPDVLLGPEALEPERHAAAAEDPELEQMVGAEIRMPVQEAAVLVDQLRQLVEVQAVLALRPRTGRAAWKAKDEIVEQHTIGVPLEPIDDVRRRSTGR